MDDTEVCQLDLIKISSLITEAELEGDPPHAHPLFPSPREVNYQAEPIRASCWWTRERGRKKIVDDIWESFQAFRERQINTINDRKIQCFPPEPENSWARLFSINLRVKSVASDWGLIRWNSKKILRIMMFTKNSLLKSGPNPGIGKWFTKYLSP